MTDVNDFSDRTRDDYEPDISDYEEQRAEEEYCARLTAPSTATADRDPDRKPFWPHSGYAAVT
jgi:hypothetical protein